MQDTCQAFRLSFADKSFSWWEEKYEKLPVIREQNGTISQPMAFYFGFLARTKAEAISSLRPRAYTLRGWMDFLWRQGLSLREGGNDLVMHRYVQSERDSPKSIPEDQISLKVSRIFEFYRDLPDAMGYWEDGDPIEEFVGDRTTKRPITTKSFTARGERYIRWSGQGRRRQVGPNPSVLDADQVQAVYQAARTKINVVGGPPAGQKRAVLAGERNWMLANCMARGGLRAAETTDITCASITDALRRENLLSSLEKRFGPISNVAELSCRPEAQELLLTALKVFEQKKRRMYLFVNIVGKGDKQRHAAFPIDLARDLITVGIWTVRHQQLLGLSLESRSNVPDTVFLSFKTVTALLPGSVSDLMKAAFISAGIEGSGHELRKFYATNTANQILKRTLDDLGYLTQAVLNTVYDRVASALGHSSVNTTTKHYVNVAMVNYTGLESRRQRRKLLSIWEMLIAEQDNIDQERIRLCGTAIKSIAYAPKNSDLYAILEGALTDPTINPDGMIKFASPKPNLRLVASNPE